MPVTDVSSPGSESMSPPTPHAMSPAVQSQSARNYFGVTEPKIQTPVAVVSGRPSLNGTQVDAKRWLFNIFMTLITLFFLSLIMSVSCSLKNG